MNHADNAADAHDPMGFAEQTDRIFDVQNVEQHDEGR